MGALPGVRPWPQHHTALGTVPLPNPVLLFGPWETVASGLAGCTGQPVLTVTCCSSKAQCCGLMGTRWCGTTAGACRCPHLSCAMRCTCSVRPAGVAGTFIPAPFSCTSQVGAILGSLEEKVVRPIPSNRAFRVNLCSGIYV